MKHLAIILICSALVPTIHAAALTQAQQSYFQNRRICVGRDTTTLPGYVINWMLSEPVRWKTICLEKINILTITCRLCHSISS